MSVDICVDGVVTTISDKAWAAMSPPPIGDPPAPIADVSDRQFFQALADAGKITEDEALAYIGPGTLPQSIVTGLLQLPDEQRFPAKMLMIGARSFERRNPLAAQLGAIFGMSSADLDALWQAAALL